MLDPVAPQQPHRDIAGILMALDDGDLDDILVRIVDKIARRVSFNPGDAFACHNPAWQDINHMDPVLFQF